MSAHHRPLPANIQLMADVLGGTRYTQVGKTVTTNTPGQTTIHTIAAGKRFFLTHAMLSGRPDAGSTGEANINVYTESGADFNVLHIVLRGGGEGIVVVSNPVFPIVALNAAAIRTQLVTAGLIVASVYGWEEPIGEVF